MPRLISQKAKIAVIEGKETGGTCVNTGCTPTKTLVASAKTAYKVKTGGNYGVYTGKVAIHFNEVIERMNKIRHGNRDGFTDWLRNSNDLDFFEGYAAFTDRKIVTVNNELLTAEFIFIHTGARARKLPLPGIDSVDWLDNERLLNLKELPEHLIIVGGSYIGLEFAQIYNRFGAKVTVLEAAPQIMFREDADVAGSAAEILRDEYIQIIESVDIKDVSGNVKVEFEKEGTGNRVEGTHLLSAAGRVPNSEALELDRAGIEYDQRGFILTNEYLETNVEGVFALGDVNGRGAFTHTSVNDGEIVIDYLNGGKRKVTDRVQIYAMFVDPPLARIGLSEREAVEKKYRILKSTRPMNRINRAKEMGETAGFIKILVDADSEKWYLFTRLSVNYCPGCSIHLSRLLLCNYLMFFLYTQKKVI